METVTAKEDIQNVKKEDATSPQHEGAQPSSTGTTTNNITKNNGDNGAATDGDGKEKPPATKVSRKRTKTGCLSEFPCERAMNPQSIVPQRQRTSLIAIA